MIVYLIPTRTLILLAILAVWMMMFAVEGRAQTPIFYRVDSSEKVRTLLLTPIGSTQATPIVIQVSSGDGAKFARVGVPLEIAITPAKDSEMYVNWELDSVTAVIGDQLTISYRALSNSKKFAWSPGAWVRVVNDNGVIIKQLQTKINAAAVLPAQGGNANKYLMTDGALLSWTTPAGGGSGVASYNSRTGAVIPVNGDYSFAQIAGVAGMTQGGTGLSSIVSGTLLYAPSNNVLAALSVGTGLSIGSGALNVSIAPFTTSNLVEGSRLYYTDTRTRLALSAASPVLYDNTTGIISLPQATSLNDGYLNHSDWTTFNNKQAALTLPLSIANGGTGVSTIGAARLVWTGDTTGHAGQAWGDLLGGGFGFMSVGGGGGTGTVTSVALTAPAEISVAGSPVTSSGTLALTWAAETGNSVLSSPSGGGSGAPVFRSLVAADIPSLAASKITSGTLAVAQGGTNIASYTADDLLYATGTTTLAKLAIGTNGQILTVTAGAPAWATAATGTVTSVALSLPGEFSVSGSPITTSGTLSGAWATQTTNKFFAAPNGSTGTPVFRAIVGADIPTLNQSTTGSAATLTTPRAINGVNFDGSAPITVTAAAGTLTGGTLAAGVTASSLTSLGTIGTGVWNATAISVLNGGTGLTATTAKQILYSSATNTIAGLATANNGVLVTDGSGTPSISSTLPAAVMANVWGTSGTSGTTYGTNFIGTTDAQGLQFRVNSAISGLIEYVTPSNTGFGYQVLSSLSTGQNNAAFGWRALKNTTSGQGDVAVGLEALLTNTTGSENAAVGYDALVLNTTGGNCTATGYQSLQHNTTGSTNSAFGKLSLGNNTTGGNNVGLGDETLLTNTTGSNLTGLGTLTDVGSDGLTNATAIGYNAIVAASNTIQLGNGSVTAIVTNGAWNGAKVSEAYGGTNQSTYTTGDLLYASTTNTLSKLPIGGGGSNFLTSAGGVPNWTNIDISTMVVGLLDGAHGGTNRNNYAGGDLLYGPAGAGSNLSILTIGATNAILTVSGGVPAWTSTPSFGATTFTGNVTMSGSTNAHVQATQVSTYTALASDCVIPCDATTGAFTVTLPASPAIGQIVWITKIDASVNAVTVAPNTGQGIVGVVGNMSIPAQGTSTILVYMGNFGGTNRWLSR